MLTMHPRTIYAHAPLPLCGIGLGCGYVIMISRSSIHWDPFCAEQTSRCVPAHSLAPPPICVANNCSIFDGAGAGMGVRKRDGEGEGARRGGSVWPGVCNTLTDTLPT
jgi:hypothetical protein